MTKPVVERTAEEKIIDAARSVFLQKGYTGARMQDIADEAGINKALLHYYFRSKEKLFEVIFREAFDLLIPKVVDIFSSDMHFFNKLRGFIATYVNMAMENPYIPLFVLNQLHTNPDQFRKPFGAIAKRVPLPMFREEIARAVKQKIIRPVEPHQLIMHIMSLCLFPSMARPMFQMVMQVTDAQFREMAEARREAVADFVIQAIRV
jgi:AcrR family transcriptional regulator